MVPDLGTSVADTVPKKDSQKDKPFTGMDVGITNRLKKVSSDEDESAGTEDMPEEALSYVLGL